MCCTDTPVGFSLGMSMIEIFDVVSAAAGRYHHAGALRGALRAARPRGAPPGGAAAASSGFSMIS